MKALSYFILIVLLTGGLAKRVPQGKLRVAQAARALVSGGKLQFREFHPELIRVSTTIASYDVFEAIAIGVVNVTAQTSTYRFVDVVVNKLVEQPIEITINAGTVLESPANKVMPLVVSDRRMVRFTSNRVQTVRVPTLSLSHRAIVPNSTAYEITNLLVLHKYLMEISDVKLPQTLLWHEVDKTRFRSLLKWKSPVSFAALSPDKDYMRFILVIVYTLYMLVALIGHAVSMTLAKIRKCIETPDEDEKDGELTQLLWKEAQGYQGSVDLSAAGALWMAVPFLLRNQNLYYLSVLLSVSNPIADSAGIISILFCVVGIIMVTLNFADKPVRAAVRLFGAAALAFLCVSDPIPTDQGMTLYTPAMLVAAVLHVVARSPDFIIGLVSVPYVLQILKSGKDRRESSSKLLSLSKMIETVVLVVNFIFFVVAGSLLITIGASHLQLYDTYKLYSAKAMTSPFDQFASSPTSGVTLSASFWSFFFKVLGAGFALSLVGNIIGGLGSSKSPAVNAVPSQEVAGTPTQESSQAGKGSKGKKSAAK